MNWKELETKYVEERVAILRHISKIYGPRVIKEAREAKAEVIFFDSPAGVVHKITTNSSLISMHIFIFITFSVDHFYPFPPRTYHLPSNNFT